MDRESQLKEKARLVIDLLKIHFANDMDFINALNNYNEETDLEIYNDNFLYGEIGIIIGDDKYIYEIRQEAIYKINCKTHEIDKLKVFTEVLNAFENDKDECVNGWDCLIAYLRKVNEN